MLDQEDDYRICVIAKTENLSVDERLNKSYRCIHKNFATKLLLNYHDNDQKLSKLSGNIKCIGIKLFTRNIFKPGKFLIIKAFEFFIQIKFNTRKTDFLWIHEEWPFLCCLFGKKDKFIWDLHETPTRFLKQPYKKIFQIIERKAKFIVHANEFRIDYLIKMSLVQSPEKHVALSNYPNRENLPTKNKPKKYCDFKNWLKDSKYAYIQGVNKKDRFPVESISAILEASEEKVCVVGAVEEEVKLYLTKKYGKIILTRVFFVGRIEACYIPLFLSDAMYSIVLYDDKDINNKLCAPNRFYHALSLGVPVITGLNPPLKTVIDKFENGIIIAGYGESINSIKTGIISLLNNYNEIKSNAKNHSDRFLWDEDSMATFIKNLIQK